MNKKEIAEIKKQFTPANCSITRMQYMTFLERLLMEPKCTMHQKKFMNTFCAAFVQ